MNISPYQPEVMRRSDFQAGLSSFTCPCGFVLSAREAENFQQSIGFDCPSCEDFIIEKDMIKNVSYNCRHLLKDWRAKRGVWYHATDRKNWIEELAQDETGLTPYVHVGTLAAAKELAWFRYFTEGLTPHDEPVYLYEVKLVCGVKLSSDISTDTNKWDQYVTTSDTNRADAVRYVNIWEAAGSVSMLVDFTKLVVRKVRALEFRECSTTYLEN